MENVTDKKQAVEEKRVKKTVIRRRTKESEPLKTPLPIKGSEADQPVEASAPVQGKEARVVKPEAEEQRVIPSDFVIPGEPKAKEKEEKVKKSVRKKKSKAELELEDIQRAGGLKQFAEQSLNADWEPSVERIFEPTLAKGRRKRVLRREFKKTAITETGTHKKVIPVEKVITVTELSQKMGIKTSEIIKKLIHLGVMVTANQGLDVDTATLVAGDFGFEVEHTAFKEEELFKVHTEAKEEHLKTRAPVVTVMGHVDHGKTSILDFIRKTKVTEKEAGGITQHIGAYEVQLPKGKITFIDTPGHEAFTRMRSRGAKITDVVVLVVAGDDGIMPQTIEAIDHAKAAGVPMIVAVNKMDKPQADLEKVKRGLTEHGLVPEEWGGEVACLPVSAKTGQGIDSLLEMILLTADVKELKGKFEGPAKGVVIESRLEKGRGVVATVLVQSGILRTGDYVVGGLSSGKIRAMMEADTSLVDEAEPSKPVEILGLNQVPQAGDELFVVKDEREAKRVMQGRETRDRAEKLNVTSKLTLEQLQEKISRGEVHDLPLVIKADVAGSAEALVESLEKLSAEGVRVKILHQAAGGITESDVVLAHASRAVIIGFNVTAEGKARVLAEREGVDIRIHSIIYEVIEDIQKALQGLLKPKAVEKYLGRAKVRQVFKISKVGTIAGCLVSDGLVRRGAKIRLTRDGAIVYEGGISSLKRFKEDAREVASGTECGIGLESYDDIKEGDEIEAYVMTTS